MTYIAATALLAGLIVWVALGGLGGKGDRGDARDPVGDAAETMAEADDLLERFEVDRVAAYVGAVGTNGGWRESATSAR